MCFAACSHKFVTNMKLHQLKTLQLLREWLDSKHGKRVSMEQVV